VEDSTTNHEELTSVLLRIYGAEAGVASRFEKTYAYLLEVYHAPPLTAICHYSSELLKNLSF
jgi:hypothetical protein